MSTNIHARRNALGINLYRLIDTRVKRLVLIAVGLLAVVSGLLAAAGFWSPDSPRYWRRPAQSVLFFTARHAPRSLTAPLMRRALRTHAAGTRYDEAEEAAALFEGVGENRAAAQLRLGLVRVDATSDRLEQAVRHATLSQQDAPSEEALAALVVLTIKDAERRGQWASELQMAYPEHEMSLATLCLAQLQSFGNAVPVVCQKVGWVSEKAASGKGEYEKLSAQIRNLPNEARANIRKHEQEIAEREAEQQGYRADLADIDRQKSEATADAVTGVIINLLPLPKSGDTLESFVAREGVCLLPYVRWFCAAGSLGPAFDAKKRHQQLDEHRKIILELISLSDELNGYDRRNIEYWRSGAPLEKLKKAQGAILPAFRADVEETVSARRSTAGLPLDEAVISAAL